MTNPTPRSTSFLSGSLRRASFAVVLVYALLMIATQPTHAQTFTVLHSFSGPDGSQPNQSLRVDQDGNIYGTTTAGGLSSNCGEVFKLAPAGSGWILSRLYAFHGSDGCAPNTRVAVGPDGAFYGAAYGGNLSCNSGCGVVYKLRPPATACVGASCPWTESVLYAFDGSSGNGTGGGELVFDQTGNIYGILPYGGAYNEGAVFKLWPSQDGWTESVLYYFTGGADGGYPQSQPTFDRFGNLYGVCYNGGNGYGTVYQLTPSAGRWVESVVYSFAGGSDGFAAVGSLVFDAAGNLYGTTDKGGQNYTGTVFELTPSNGGWTHSVIYSFTTGVWGGGPQDVLARDQAGNLYGTAPFDGLYSQGVVFKLTPTGEGWIYTSLHDFTGGSDGYIPFGGVTLDANGNLYGTAFGGGGGNCSNPYGPGCGTVWKITP